jgi:hypothetical protein
MVAHFADLEGSLDGDRLLKLGQVPKTGSKSVRHGVGP